jgi:APA family basic amino acid/polyamine antiporter
VFSELHPKFKTPYKSNIILFVMVGLFAAFVPGSVAGDLTSFGTLFAFVIVCAGIIVMRKTHPNLHRPFRTPLVPLVPILGILVCLFMIAALSLDTLVSAGLWMVIGLLIYFLYGRKRSKLKGQDNTESEEE